jgi:hypothetical protein
MPQWYEVEVEVLEVGSDYLLVSDGEVDVQVPFDHIGPDSEITEESCEGDSGVLQIPDWFAIDEGMIEA